MEPEQKNTYNGLTISIMLSALLILIGVVTYLKPDTPFIWYVYGTSVLAVILGIVMMTTYFHTHGYRRMSNYNFAFGFLILLGGGLLFSRASAVTRDKRTFLGTLILIIAIFLLQYAIQVKALRSGMWGLIFGFFLLIALAAALILVNPRNIASDYFDLCCDAAFITGILGIISVILVWTRIRRFDREDRRNSQRNMEEAGNFSADDSVGENVFDNDQLTIEQDDDEEP